jgi:hypothetical protein
MPLDTVVPVPSVCYVGAHSILSVVPARCAKCCCLLTIHNSQHHQPSTCIAAAALLLQPVLQQQFCFSMAHNGTHVLRSQPHRVCGLHGPVPCWGAVGGRAPHSNLPPPQHTPDPTPPSPPSPPHSLEAGSRPAADSRCLLPLRHPWELGNPYPCLPYPAACIYDTL